MLTKRKTYLEDVYDIEMSCKICGEELVMTEQEGTWICPLEEEEHYLELNNVTICHSPNCTNIVISKSKVFTTIEEQYCNVLPLSRKEYYIQDGYGYYYDAMTCLEFIEKGIQKKRVKKGVILSCFECGGQLIIKETGYLMCEQCGTEIDKSTSLFLKPLYDPDITTETIKKIKLD